MLTAIIIDDELKGRIALRQKLMDYCDEVNIIGEGESAEDGISLIQLQKPDIVFLDIEMPRMDGFKMLQQLPEKNFHLIFTTAYDQYAIKEHPKLMASKTLKDFEDLLPATMFFRIHHSYIINVKYIEKYIKGEGGQVELQGGIFLDVSRRKKEEFLKLIRL